MARKKNTTPIEAKPKGPQSIKIDAKLYDFIAASARPFESPSEVLVRLLNVGGKK